MDIHRCRFVPYKPSAINAIAFSHPVARSAQQGARARLAIGRGNGDIEIWNPQNGSWNQELIIPGGKDRSIDGLVWVNQPDQDLGDGRVVPGKSRLFSIGWTSTVTEWDLETGRPKRHASGQHGDIWCMAAQPAEFDQDCTKLIAGTIDGELVEFSIEDDNLRFEKVVLRLPTKKTQMVSICFQSHKIAIVGCSDNTIRAYDLEKRHMLRRMTLGSDLGGGAKDIIIVWSVKCLPNGNIVSGDSTGQVCIWDGKTYTQTQRMQSHKKDVLSLATSADGTAILSGGMDRRTILYKQNANAGSRWGKVWGRRYHDHDAKCMASFESGKVSVVVSGGPDANPVVIPLKEMGRENHRMMPALPQQAPLLGAPKARFVVSFWEREIHIWLLRKSTTDLVAKNSDKKIDINKNRKLLKTIVVKGDSNITSATIDDEGSLLVVSTAIDVKAFRLEHQDPVNPSDVKISSAELPQKLAGVGAIKVQLSPNAQWLCAVQEGSRVVMAALDPVSPRTSLVFSPRVQRLTRLRRQIPRHILNGGMGSYDRTITQVAFSPDSKMLAVSDIAGYIDTWILSDGEKKSEDDASSASESDSSDEEEESSQGIEKWIRNPGAKLMPKLQNAATVLSFSADIPQAKVSPRSSFDGINGPSNLVDDYTLLAITSGWNLLLFHPLQGCLTPWSRKHTRKDLPAPVQDLLDLPKGVFWQGSRAWIYGVSFLLMLDLAQDLPKPTESEDATATPGKNLKRKRTGPSTGAGGRMEQGAIAPSLIRKHTAGQWEDVDMEDAPNPEDANSDDEDQPEGELAQLRNRREVGKDEGAETGGERKSWWMTFKYRPIFGVVPISTADQPLEVALVERPTWDMDMPDSYFNVEQWRK